MIRMIRNLIIACAFLGGLAGTLRAEVTSTEGINLGEHWYGPQYKVEDLKGRVVLFELWGIN